MGKDCLEQGASQLPIRSLEDGLAEMVHAFAGRVGMFPLQCHPVIHKSVIPGPRLKSVHGHFHQWQQVTVVDTVPILEKVMYEDAADVGFDEYFRKVIGKSHDSACGVRAYAGQG